MPPDDISTTDLFPTSLPVPVVSKSEDTFQPNRPKKLNQLIKKSRSVPSRAKKWFTQTRLGQWEESMAERHGAAFIVPIVSMSTVVLESAIEAGKLAAEGESGSIEDYQKIVLEGGARAVVCAFAGIGLYRLHIARNNIERDAIDEQVWAKAAGYGGLALLFVFNTATEYLDEIFG